MMYFAFAIMYFIPVIMPMIVSEEYPVDINTMHDPRLLILNAIVWAGVCFFMSLQFRSDRPIALPQIWITCLLLWSVASSAWAVDPTQAARKIIWEIPATLFGLYLGSRLSLKEETKLLLVVLTVCGVLSVIAVAIDPRWAIMRGGALDGDWRGIFGHKNSFGRFMALLCYCSAYLWKTRAFSSRAVPGLTFVFGAILIVMSHSGTALVELLGLLAFLCFLRVLKVRSAIAVPVGLAVLGTGVIIAALVQNNLPLLLHALGKRSDLTGRTELWQVLVTMISRKPWCGYGYNGFWYGMQGPSAFVMEKVGWMVVHAHNGILETALDTGLIGVALILLAYSYGLTKAVRAYRSTSSYELLWPVLFLLLYGLSNIAETTILHSDVFWILFVSVTAPSRFKFAQADQTERLRDDAAHALPLISAKA